MEKVDFLKWIKNSTLKWMEMRELFILLVISGVVIEFNNNQFPLNYIFMKALQSNHTIK